MKLPDDSIGVTDILQYRDCARRFAFGMRRHTSAGEHPQATSPSNAYGSAFHDAVEFIAKYHASDGEAVREVMGGRFGRWLSPDDLERMHADLETYRERDYSGVAPIAIEREYKMPLFKHNGVQIYFRGRIDRLYQSLRDPGTFIHIDYKTSKHPKTDEEVHKDVQLSSYAMTIRWHFPECRTLIQIMDQLNFGAVPTSRTDEQIAFTKEWLIENAITILEDDTLEPTYNTFCAYCPIIMDCPIVPILTDYALGEISGLMPKEEDGKLVGPNGVVLEGAALEPYVEALEKVSEARKVLDAFDGRVRGTLKELPVDRRLEMGFKTTTPNVSTWPPEALEALSEVLGPQFWQLINLPKKAVSRLPKDTQEMVNSLAVKHRGAPRMTRAKRAPVESAFGDQPAPEEPDDAR